MPAVTTDSTQLNASTIATSVSVKALVRSLKRSISLISSSIGLSQLRQTRTIFAEVAKSTAPRGQHSAHPDGDDVIRLHFEDHPVRRQEAARLRERAEAAARTARGQLAIESDPQARFVGAADERLSLVGDHRGGDQLLRSGEEHHL